MTRHRAQNRIRATHAIEAPTDAGSSVVIFEAPNLPTLAADIAAWAGAHPQSTILSLSHARETRLEERASLAGPAHIPVYTGLLLVSSASSASPTRHPTI